MDDRSWFTTNTTACVSIAQHWQAATPRLQLGENPSKADFTAFGPNANQQALQNALTNANCPGTVKPRIKILGSITQPQRRPCGPAAEDTARLTQANRVIKWARMLPHPCINKAAFAKATGLAIAAAPSFTRLPAQRELDPLRKSMAHAHGNPVIQCGPLFRLIAGHTADPYYRVGHTATMHTLTTAFNDAHLRRLWPTAPTQGPINTAKHWLKRQGWNNTGPWRWNHNQANYIINAAAVEADPGNHTVIDLTNFTKAALDHALREGWRAHTWMDFKATGNRAALTLQHYQWTDVADRAKKAALAYQKARPEHRQHILAIITNRYVSQARYDHNRSKLYDHVTSAMRRARTGCTNGGAVLAFTPATFNRETMSRRPWDGHWTMTTTSCGPWLLPGSGCLSTATNKVLAHRPCSYSRARVLQLQRDDDD